MSHPIHLPGAYPEITSPTLLVICDAHHCNLFDLGGHTLMLKEEIRSKEHVYTDHQTVHASSGSPVGLGENDQIEAHRLHEFTNTLGACLAKVVAAQKIESVYLSAPGKFLSHLTSHLPAIVSKMLVSTIDGNFVKEPPLETLARFRPDLKTAMQELRNGENYSTKNHLPS